MLKIGLTGISGSGKSYVSAEFAKHGVFTINTDEVTHELYSGRNECTEAISRIFGDNILNEDYSVNRRRLAAIVFGSREKLALLNSTVHGYILAKCDEIIGKQSDNGSKAVLIEAPQLFESGFDKSCDRIISVVADKSARIRRIEKRDSISEEEAEKRICNQHDDEYFKSKSDFVIYSNDGDNIESQVCEIIDKLGISSL